MCGIAGIYKDTTKVNQKEIDQLTDALKHRGPDGRGIWFNAKQNLALGHRRLSILDLTDAGRQPMLSHDGNVVLTLNGEIYNFIEIKNELIAKGYSFKSETDTEMILTAYQEWGLQMLDKFNGMWAFAIYDIETEKLILSRDRFGVKPFYYYWDGSELAFASEVQALHKYLGKRATVNPETINAILNFDQSYHGTEQTYLNEVKSLQAGTNLIFQNNKLSLESWYHLKRVKVPKSLKSQALELQHLLTDAIKLRLRSDVPIGTCLSGGIDSGAISSLISTFKANDDKRFSNFTHRSFCAGFPGVAFDETNDATRLANQLNIDLDIEVINPPSPERLEQAISQTDGPMPAFAFFSIWQLYRYIKTQGITVTLDGQGADEMLGGYYLGYEAMKSAMELGDLTWLLDVRATYGALHPKANKWVQDHFNMVKKEKITAIKQAIKYPVKKILSVLGLYQLKSLPQHHKNKKYSVEPYFKNSFEKALYNQFFKTPLPFLLHQYDRASMANGIECRMPFMDYRVVEYIFSLPSLSKVGGGYTKRVLREALKGILPDETRLNKTKTGFNSPTTEWFQSELKDWFLSQITSSSFKENPYFDGEQISAEFMAALDSNTADRYKWKFWSYIHVNYWLNQINKSD